MAQPRQAQLVLELATQTPVPGGYGEYLATTLAVLVGVCLLAWVAIRFGLRRLMPGAKAGRGDRLVNVVARVPLEPRQMLYVVEVAGKTLLLGSGDRPLSTLAELDGNTVSAALRGLDGRRGASFRDVLASLRGVAIGDDSDSGAASAAGTKPGSVSGSASVSASDSASGSDSVSDSDSASDSASGSDSASVSVSDSGSDSASASVSVSASGSDSDSGSASVPASASVQKVAS